jgi:hypothetical protein
MIKKVEKIVALEKKLEQANEKEKYKLEQKIKKLKRDFYIGTFTISQSDGEEIELENVPKVYHDKKTKHETLVDGEHIIALNYVPSPFTSNFFSFILAHLILLTAYFVCTILFFFDILFTERFFNSLGLVLVSATVVLNVWTGIACKDVVKKHKWLFLVLVFSVAFNLGNLVNYLERMFSIKLF